MAIGHGAQQLLMMLTMASRLGKAGRLWLIEEHVDDQEMQGLTELQKLGAVSTRIIDHCGTRFIEVFRKA